MKRRLTHWLPSALLMLSAPASAAPADTIYAHAGRLVAVSDGARLNFICMGTGSPAVIFESTFDDWAPAWATVLPRIATWTRACAYEHAGAGFSDPGPMPRTNLRPDPSCAEFFFRGLPEPKFSPELNAALLKLVQSKVAVYDAALSEWEQVPQTEAWLKQHSQSLGSRPLRVLTTGNHAVHFLPAANAHDPQHLEYEHQIELAQARLLTLSANAKQILVPNSSEYVQFDAPDAVVDAIGEVYDQSGGAKTHY